MVGYDASRLKSRIVIEGKGWKYRATGHNVYIASNFKQIHAKHHQLGDVSYMILGGGHETLFDFDHRNNKIFTHSNPLPISHTLAYYGYNVVVVDHTTK